MVTLPTVTFKAFVLKIGGLSETHDNEQVASPHSQSGDIHPDSNAEIRVWQLTYPGKCLLLAIFPEV